MKKLLVKFYDTDKELIIDENCLVCAFEKIKNERVLCNSIILEFDDFLPEKLLNRPLMFYIYDDIPILKFYRSSFIKECKWVD